MKRIASILGLGLVVAGFITQASPARADAVQSGREVIDVVVTDPANNEPVWLQGENQFTFRETYLPDGTVLSVFRFTAHGTGLGLWSRTPYQFNQTHTYSWIDPVGLAYRIDSRDVLHLISRGANPNAAITQTMAVIRDDTGAYTFEFHFDYDVRGRGN